MPEPVPLARVSFPSMTAASRPAVIETSRERLVHIAGLEKIYATKDGETIHALKDVNLDIGTGEFISVVGPSGCGKTTLLKILAGILRSFKRRSDDAGPPPERTKPRNRRRIPGARVAAVAYRAAERDGAGRGPEARSRHVRSAGAPVDQHGRARWIRAQISRRAFRRHAAAGRHLPRAGARSLVPADG